MFCASLCIAPNPSPSNMHFFNWIVGLSNRAVWSGILHAFHIMEGNISPSLCICYKLQRVVLQANTVVEINSTSRITWNSEITYPRIMRFIDKFRYFSYVELRSPPHVYIVIMLYYYTGTRFVLPPSIPRQHIYSPFTFIHAIQHPGCIICYFTPRVCYDLTFRIYVSYTNNYIHIDQRREKWT